METLIWLACAVGLVLSVAVVHVEARWRWRWQRVARGFCDVHAGGGVYRQPSRVPVYLRCAPRDVRLAAIGSIVTAELLLVAMLAFFAVFAAHATLAEISSLAALLWTPSVLVAVRLVRDGLALLRRETRPAGVTASGLALWALLFYFALLVGMFVLLQLVSTMVSYPANPPGQGWAQIFVLVLLLFTWPALALAQAMMLERVSARHDADLL